MATETLRTTSKEDHLLARDRLIAIKHLLSGPRIADIGEVLARGQQKPRLKDGSKPLSESLIDAFKRLDPLASTGIPSLEAAVRNYEAQERIDRKIIPTLNRKIDEAKWRRDIILAESQPVPEEPALFDVFSKSDLSRILHSYSDFLPEIRNSKIQPDKILTPTTLAAIHKSHIEPDPNIVIPRAPTQSAEEVIQRRNEVIEKLQNWLDTPDLNIKMDEIIGEVDDNLWNLFDSIIAINEYLKNGQPQPAELPKSLKGYLEAHFKNKPQIVYTLDPRGFVDIDAGGPTSPSTVAEVKAVKPIKPALVGAGIQAIQEELDEERVTQPVQPAIQPFIPVIVDKAESDGEKRTRELTEDLTTLMERYIVQEQKLTPGQIYVLDSLYRLGIKGIGTKHPAKMLRLMGIHANEAARLDVPSIITYAYLKAHPGGDGRKVLRLANAIYERDFRPNNS